LPPQDQRKLGPIFPANRSQHAAAISADGAATGRRFDAAWFIGDAILVSFGTPVRRPDAARRAVACAIAMQRAMKGSNAHDAKLGLPRIEMGIAQHI
jgi:class 3 adenylate cyclase